MVATGISLLLVFTMVFFPTVTHAFPSTPNVSFPQFNNNIDAVTSAPDGSLYVGGTFTGVNAITAGNGIAAATSSSTVQDMVRPNTTVNATVPDGVGGWYIGGSFTSVGGVTRNRVAHIMADGTLGSFNPNITGTSVNALAYNGLTDTLYIGGVFSTVNGATSRTNVAAVSTITGTATSFNPSASAAVGTGVNALVLDIANSLLYLGGNFTSVTGGTRNRVAAFDIGTGTVTSFNPNINNTVFSLSLDTANGLLYVGGSFTQVNGATGRNRLAAVSTSTGTATGFNPNVANIVSALALDIGNGLLYAGGNFTTVNSVTTRNRLAAFSTSTGTATSFDPNLSSTVSALHLDSANSTLYVGGNFTTVNGTTTRLNAAAVSTSTGLVNAFAPNPTGQVNALSLDTNNDRLYLGGTFAQYGGTVRNRILKLLPDGTLDSAFNVNMVGSAVNALLFDAANNLLYIGGTFTAVNGNSARSNLAAVNASTGAATSFNPNVSATVETLALGTGTLYLGGTFTQVGGNGRNRFAAVSTATGLVTTLNPNFSSRVRALAIDEAAGIGYAGGAFSQINGSTPRSFFAAFSLTTGTATSFDPAPDGEEVYSLLLDKPANTLYIGGGFNDIGGVTRPQLAAFNILDGSLRPLDAGFDYDGNYVGTIVRGTGNELYVGGTFTASGGAPRNRMAQLDAVSGALGSFNPADITAPINELSISQDGTTLYGGGGLLGAGANNNYLVAFRTSPPSGGGSSGEGTGPREDQYSGQLAETGQDEEPWQALAYILLLTGAGLVAARLRQRQHLQ